MSFLLCSYSKKNTKKTVVFLLLVGFSLKFVWDPPAVIKIYSLSVLYCLFNVKY